MQKTERNRIAILNALRRAVGPATSIDLARALAEHSHALSERTVRLYLRAMDDEGLTRSHGRRGRTLTERGLAEVSAAGALERVGYLTSLIDQMTYRMTFDLQTRRGEVVVNTSMISPSALASHIGPICRVFERGYAMGTLAAVLPPGTRIGEAVVPPDLVGLCTVCSITVNGVLLKHGVPTHSRFGGLLELRNGRPTRFVEMIHYDGTSIDPLVVFIRSGMTDYHGAIATGNGLVGASFREIPEDSRERVLRLGERLEAVGLGALVQVGQPGQEVLGLPVNEGRIGAVVIGGLNPVAILDEAGHHAPSRAMAGLLDYSRLVHYRELPAEVRRYV
jgi:hypothetical protein